MDKLYFALVIAAGGAIGAVSRYGVGLALNNRYHNAFPWGTLTANLVGAFVIGLLFTLFKRLDLPDRYQFFVITGFLGAFTTFSSFCLESWALYEDGRVKAALIYVGASNIGGLILVATGFWLGNLFFRGTPA